MEWLGSMLPYWSILIPLGVLVLVRILTDTGCLELEYPMNE